MRVLTLSQTPARAKLGRRRFIAFLIIGGLVYLTTPFLIPVVMGGIFAVVTYPIYQKFSKKLPPRIASASVMLLLMLALIVPASLILVLGMRTSIEQLKTIKLEQSTDGSTTNVAQSITRTPIAQRLMNSTTEKLGLPQGALTEFTKKGVQQGIATITAFLGSFVIELPNLGAFLFIMALALYYFFLEGQNLLRFSHQVSPFKPQGTKRLLRAINSTCHSTLLATVVSGIAQTSVMTLGLVATQTPNLPLVCLFTFLSSFLPILGTTPVTFGVFLYHLAMGNDSSAGIILGVGLLVSITDNLVRPLVLKDRSDIHPLLGFVSAFGGLTILGFTGLFIGPVVAGIAMELIPIMLQESEEEHELARVHTGSTQG